MTLDAKGELVRQIGWRTAAMVVIANMVGSGIFTTTGFMARDLGSPWRVLALWVAGGCIALAGALAYAELGAALPEAGGEYAYLREAYGPLPAYLSGWTSFFAGFSGALAAALFGFSAYLQRALQGVMALPDARVVALATLWALTAVHVVGAGPGGKVQRVLTAATVVAIVVLVAAGFAAGDGSTANFLASAPAEGSAAVSLIFVLYAYSGWNAAAYLAGEIHAPERGIPRALLCGTTVVMALYVALNALYLYALPIPQMAGVLEVGERAVAALFGNAAARIVGGIIALAILSSASAMVLTGPRVYYAMAGDGLMPRRLGAVSPRFGTPAAAILLQSAWTSVLILAFGVFEPVVVYTGFAVTLFSAIAVAAVLVLRARRPMMQRPFSMPAGVGLVAVYVSVSAWIVAHVLVNRPMEALLGLATVGAGAPLYYVARWRRDRGGLAR